MNKVVIPLVLVFTITIGLSYQEADAVPNCALTSLQPGEVYIGDNDGELWRFQPSDGGSCSMGVMTSVIAGPITTEFAVKCFDVALHPVTGVLYCITPSDLWTIDQDEGAGGTPDAHYVGALLINGGPATVSQANAMDSNAAGQFYIVTKLGRFFSLNENTGFVSQLNPNLGQFSAGDLAWDPTTGNMYWTTDNCPGCMEGTATPKDGLYSINLGTNTASFVAVLAETGCVGGGCVNDGFNAAFAMDMLGTGNLCIATRGGEQFAFDPVAGAQVGMTKTASPPILANGGTAINSVAGGIGVPDEKSLILGVIFPNSIWTT